MSVEYQGSSDDGPQHDEKICDETVIRVAGEADEEDHAAEGDGKVQPETRPTRPRNPTWPKAAAVIATAPTSGKRGKRARAHAMMPAMLPDGMGMALALGGGARNASSARRQLSRIASPSSDSDAFASQDAEDSSTTDDGKGKGKGKGTSFRSRRMQRTSTRLGAMTHRSSVIVWTHLIPLLYFESEAGRQQNTEHIQ